MIELHVNSLWIGGFFGFFIGVAISFLSWYLTEVTMNKHDRFSEGWDAGVKYGKTVKEVTDEH